MRSVATSGAFVISPTPAYRCAHAGYLPRTDLLHAQTQSRWATATNQHDGKSLLIFRSRVKPGNQKYSAFVLAQISRITPPVSRRMRGVGHRHERAVRCDGRESCD